jgi:tetratricopeptide (TPR) repeat protein
MESYFNLGRYRRPITTRAAEAQIWFDRGLNWSYAFHREEALRCYGKVIEIDPQCAMGYWGIAYATGPYYNSPWPKFPKSLLPGVIQKANHYVRQAQQRAAHAAPVEQALIQALFTRFPEATCADDAVFSQWDDAYAQAMRAVYAEFPHDTDVCALTAEALMCRTPWQLWDLVHRTPAKGADTTEALAIIDAAMQRLRDAGAAPHPGLLHFYIHLMEMSPEPEKALPAADTLRALVPDSGHLIHMPSHIYILCGEYQKALDTNIAAVAADDKYVAVHSELGRSTIYRLHDIHFQIYAALFLGQYAQALRAAELIWHTVTPEVLRHENDVLVNYLEGYYGMKVHVYIRFGKWQDIIDGPMPDEPGLFVVTTALWHYAKGVAYAATGDVANGAKQQRRFLEAWERVPVGRIVFNNECRDILKVADAMLSGELEYRRQHYDAAFAHLRRAVALYDSLNYTEPWAWMQPPRHALGALLLEQGHVVEAAQVYRADLGLDDTLVRPSQHPGNIWSLHGLAECYQRLGQSAEAATIEQQLAAAQTVADIPVNSSCFCRQADACCG